MEPSHRFRFGPFVLDPMSRRLERDGEPVSLNPRAFAILLALLRRPGDLVSKDDLLEAGWGDRVVAENNLTVHMTEVRRALGDRAASGRYILTEHGRGYRFIATVTLSRAPVAGAAAPQAARIASSPDAPPYSVVVTPFTPQDDAGQTRAAAEGITNLLLAQLCRVPRASVTLAADPAAELRQRPARHVLRGSVGREGEEIHVVAFLDDAATGTTVWADRLQHRHLGIAAPEAEVASRLARVIGLALRERDAARSPADGQPAEVAREAAVRGWAALSRTLLRPADVAEARRCFDLALRSDPDHPLALAGAAQAICAEHQFLWNEGGRADLALADDLSSRAVARAPAWIGAWSARGYVKIWQRRFDAAIAAFEQALHFDPCAAFPLAYSGHAHFLAGRIDAMRLPIERATALAPRDPGVGLWHHWLGLHAFWQGNDEAAVPHFVRACNLAPGLIYPPSFLAASLAHLGRLEDASQGLRSWCEANDVQAFSIARLRAAVFSDNPTYLAGHQRLYAGLRLIGVAES
jgi:DNA-binding winged helix-turn-helix (wHTH) protein/tetratricopeptide (TPR) repeat protein